MQGEYTSNRDRGHERFGSPGNIASRQILASLIQGIIKRSRTTINKENNKMRITIISAVVATLTTLLFVYGLDKQEIYECNKWKIESEQYPNYYLTHWQKSQCDFHSIPIEAHIYFDKTK